MDDISIKILDALFDLCDGENYVILDVQDVTARIPDYAFEEEELTEILEALAAEGFIDLRYADESEFCVSMRTKGRSLIKQLRDRLQKVVERVEESASHVEDGAPVPPSDPAEEQPASTEKMRAERPVHRTRQSSFDYEQRTRSTPQEMRPRPVEDREEEEKKFPLEKKIVLLAFAGAAAGALFINLVWLILYLFWLK